jgi:hypothetical protein
MNREGTLHIVRLNRGQSAQPQYSIGFADYASPGGAMKTVEINGEEGLRSIFVGIGLNQRIVASSLDNLNNEGQASILRVILPEEMLRRIGLQSPLMNPKDKVEFAIDVLKREGHSVKVMLGENGSMWFEIDRMLRTSWDEMINLADGVYTVDVLIEVQKINRAQAGKTFPVRFTVFFEPGGPILAYSPAGPFATPTFASRAGAKYPDVGALTEALERVGLPGTEIVRLVSPTATFAVTGAQLLELGLKLPES